MATYKPYRKTESGKEEIKIPYSAVSGLATVATSGSYNDLSNKPSIPDISGKANLKGGNSWTGNQQFNQGGYWFATDTNHPFVVELENGDELVSVNQKGVNFDSSGLGSMPFLLNGNAGTSGQVLTSQGTGITPVWSDVSYDKITGTPDLSVYQTKTDNALETNDKTVVGAINEVNSAATANKTTIENIKSGSVQVGNAKKADSAANVTSTIGGVAIDEYALKADIPSGVVVVQSTGQSTSNVMSQKAVTDALSVIKTDKHSQTQLTNQDLNDLQGEETVGWYFAAGSNTCANKPTGVDAFGLEVGRSATGYYFQVLTSANSTGNRRFVRTYSSSWGGWAKLAITDDIPTKTSQLTNDSGYATTSQVNAKYTKPSGGIPKTDLASDVQTSLGKADTALQSHQDISGKANLAGDNTFTGGQTITGAKDGYSINASGYVKGSWLQAPSTGHAGSGTGKICVLDGNGWVYYRTPAEVLSEAGGAKASDVPTFSLSGTTLTITT